MTQNSTVNHPSFVDNYINLAHPRIGAEVIAVTDDFFAPAERMLQDHDPVWKAGVYDENGKWMDGWESRRKRELGHDHATIKLGKSGIIHGFEIDTTHFTGNYAPAVSIEGCHVTEGAPDDSTIWTSILSIVPISGNKQQFFAVDLKQLFSHVRLHIYPDGGIARLRVYGEPSAAHLQSGDRIDLAGMENGGRAIACNDQHFGHMKNLLMPGRGINMGDGWETRRRRSPGFDWVILALGRIGSIEQFIVDTAHFKGNYPHKVSIQGAKVDPIDRQSIVQQSFYWPELLPPKLLKPDAEHHFDIQQTAPINVIRMNIHPDGGISRLRAMGTVVVDGDNP